VGFSRRASTRDDGLVATWWRSAFAAASRETLHFVLVFGLDPPPASHADPVDALGDPTEQIPDLIDPEPSLPAIEGRQGTVEKLCEIFHELGAEDLWIDSSHAD